MNGFVFDRLTKPENCHLLLRFYLMARLEKDYFENNVNETKYSQRQKKIFQDNLNAYKMLIENIDRLTVIF